MAKMPPHSQKQQIRRYITSNKPSHRLNFPKPGDPSLFQNAGRRHYRNNFIFSTPYALFQQDNNHHRDADFSKPTSRNMAYQNIKTQQNELNNNHQLKRQHIYNDYERMKKQRDALDQQVYKLQVNRQNLQHYRPKQLSIQIKSPTNPQIQQNSEKQSQINVPQKHISQYSSIEPKRREFYPSAEGLPFTNPKKISRERIKTEATDIQQQPQYRNSALNRYVRFNPTYLSWIN